MSKYHSTTNPISARHKGPLTEHQAHSYNALLTQLTKVLSKLQQEVVNRKQADVSFYTHSVGCWHALVKDLNEVVLPEFYVVFHDDTTDARQKRQLYDMTQAIYFSMIRYYNLQFVQHLSTSTTPHFSNTHYIRSQQLVGDAETNALYSTDKKIETSSYMTGTGSIAEIAYELKAMAEYVDVNGATYLNSFDAYYNLLISETDLQKCLTNSNVKGMIRQLDMWGKQRLLAFSIPSQDTIARNSVLEAAKRQHVLATWVLQEYLVSSNYSLRYGKKGINQAQLTAYRNLSQQNLESQKASISKRKIGQLSPKGLSRAWRKVKRMLTTDITPSGRKGNTNVRPSAPLAMLSNSQSFHVTSQLSLPARDVHQSQVTGVAHAVQVAMESTHLNPQSSEVEPLTIKQHAYHLAILLTAKPTLKLKQLIVQTNSLAEHIDYLNQSHPYLAASVEEFIKDLTCNTIVRLDETASQFVTKGKVSPNIRNMFKEQHEARIERLIELNLEQVKELNKTILQKKMAGFADVGNQAENAFRNTVMELKILLRWLIAQQPDELQASSHQVILDRLEKNTLADMQSVFFDAQTTSMQRQALQQQLERLLTHFKQQNTLLIKLNSTHQDDEDIQELLQLSHKSDHLYVQSGQGMATHTEINTATNQLKNQNFIEFNQHYVDEILDHWN